MSDPAFDVSLTAEGERSMGEGDGGVRGVSSGPLRATTNSTSPRAFCRMLMACWWEMLESSGWPSIARIWSPSRSLPSLHQENQRELNNMQHHQKWNKNQDILLQAKVGQSDRPVIGTTHNSSMCKVTQSLSECSKDTVAFYTMRVCGLVDKNFPSSASTMKMEGAGSSEILEPFYQTTQLHILEASKHHVRHNDDLKAHIHA